ncbi:MAG: hypothetical protein CMO71_06185 [Verrucomicrobiales bacterium]|nr:hypothetical protein [Verrucomicrobiales bacterium]
MIKYKSELRIFKLQFLVCYSYERFPHFCFIERGSKKDSSVKRYLDGYLEEELQGKSISQFSKINFEQSKKLNNGEDTDLILKE